MMLSQMEVTDWRNAIVKTGKAEAIVNGSSLTVSEGYFDTNHRFIVGQVALVVCRESPAHYHRYTYTKWDEGTRDRIAKDILRETGLEDVNLEFHPLDKVSSMISYKVAYHLVSDDKDEEYSIWIVAENPDAAEQYVRGILSPRLPEGTTLYIRVEDVREHD